MDPETTSQPSSEGSSGGEDYSLVDLITQEWGADNVWIVDSADCGGERVN